MPPVLESALVSYPDPPTNVTHLFEPDWPTLYTVRGPHTFLWNMAPMHVCPWRPFLDFFVGGSGYETKSALAHGNVVGQPFIKFNVACGQCYGTKTQSDIVNSIIIITCICSCLIERSFRKNK